MAGQSQIELSAVSFAWLLRQLRAEARMTQEELAHKAGLSPRSISDLERGISRTARTDTAHLLADALSISGPARTAFVAAARGRAPVSEVLSELEQTSGTAVAVVVGPDAGNHGSISLPGIELFEKLIDAITALRRELAALSQGMADRADLVRRERGITPPATTRFDPTLVGTTMVGSRCEGRQAQYLV